MSLGQHHFAWLAAHPTRTEAWLRERLAEGFDVHHHDGNHANDDPANLILIEHLDHMRLHGSHANRMVAHSVATRHPKRKRGGSKAGKRWFERIMAEKRT